MHAPIGDIAAAQLLNFFIEEIGPSRYEQVQERMQLRVSELGIEVHADAFGC